MAEKDTSTTTGVELIITQDGQVMTREEMERNGGAAQFNNPEVYDK